jgi:hypothetical protein
MAEPKQRQRPKGYEIRESLRPKAMQKKPSGKGYAASGALGAEAAAAAADVVGATDPYLSRNEFKPGFYDQPKPPVSYETLKGTAAKPIPNVTDTESFAEGGSVRGQKNIQVKKKQFKGIF